MGANSASRVKFYACLFVHVLEYSNQSSPEIPYIHTEVYYQNTYICVLLRIKSAIKTSNARARTIIRIICMLSNDIAKMN